MAKAKIEISGLDGILNKLKALDADVNKVAEDALKATHKIVTEKAEEAMQPQNLPAKGKYMRKSNNTIDSLVTEQKIDWNNGVVSIKVGFDISNGGLPSIFLMYGTPKMKKDQKLYNAFYGKKTREEIIAAQEEIFWGEIRRLDK